VDRESLGEAELTALRRKQKEIQAGDRGTVGGKCRDRTLEEYATTFFVVDGTLPRPGNSTVLDAILFGTRPKGRPARTSPPEVPDPGSCRPGVCGYLLAAMGRSDWYNPLPNNTSALFRDFLLAIAAREGRAACWVDMMSGHGIALRQIGLDPACRATIERTGVDLFDWGDACARKVALTKTYGARLFAEVHRPT
jgi:hypothetical protein